MGDVVNLLGSGREMGVTFTYKVQDEAGGIAQALDLAEHFVGNDQMVVILGDNVFSDSIAPFVSNFRNQRNGAKILIQEVHDPSRYGVPELDGDKIVSIVEKPINPKKAALLLLEFICLIVMYSALLRHLSHLIVENLRSLM